MKRKIVIDLDENTIQFYGDESREEFEEVMSIDSLDYFQSNYEFIEIDNEESGSIFSQPTLTYDILNRTDTGAT